MAKEILKYIAAASVAFGLLATTSANANVYQAVPGGNFAFSTASEYGDEILLGGTDRFLTGFSFEYTANFGAAAGGAFSIYAQDGVPISGVASPGSLLYTTAFDVVNGGGVVNVAFDGSTSIPDRLTYTVQFSGVGGANTAGLIADATVTEGSSGNDFWLKTGPGANDWELQNFGAAAEANFVATVTAVPEPGTVALMLLGVGGLAFAIRRRK
jgi:hypothetical protein